MYYYHHLIYIYIYIHFFKVNGVLLETKKTPIKAQSVSERYKMTETNANA
jgi:hypothetical protein